MPKKDLVNPKSEGYVVVWQGNKRSQLVHSRVAGSLEYCGTLMGELQARGVTVVCASPVDSIPPKARGWKLGDPGYTYFTGRIYSGPLDELKPRGPLYSQLMWCLTTHLIQRIEDIENARTVQGGTGQDEGAAGAD